MGYAIGLAALYLAAIWTAHRAGLAQGRNEGYALGRKDERNGVPAWAVVRLPGVKKEGKR